MPKQFIWASYAGQTDNLAVSRRLADFYLLWSKKDEANIGKAAVYINRILKAANEDNVAANNPHVVWARQKAARILFAQKDYQQSLKAERLLRQSAVNDKMSTEESELLVDILIDRRDPRSLLEAEQLLSQLHKEDRLPKKGAMATREHLEQNRPMGRGEITAQGTDECLPRGYFDSHGLDRTTHRT